MMDYANEPTCMVCGWPKRECSCMSPPAFDKFISVLQERDEAVALLRKIAEDTGLGIMTYAGIDDARKYLKRLDAGKGG